MKPAFGYLRVSGHGQVDAGGLPRQRATIEEYCTRKGLKVIRWFQDGAVSGTIAASEREQFGEMLLLAGPATTQTLVVERSDRLARTLAVSELACEEARKSGLTILEAASDTDLTNSDDPTRVMIRQVLGVVAEWNKNVMVKRLAEARKRKKQNTGRCEGKHRYGRTEEENTVLALIVLHRAQQPPTSWPQIQNLLQRRGFPTPTGRGDQWHSAVIRKLYASEVHRRKQEQRPPAKSQLIEGLLG